MTRIKAFGGTLIVAVPFEQGMVICADRVAYDVYHDESEDVQKIHQLGQNVVYGFTGHVSFRSGTDEAVSFEAEDIVRDFSSGNAFKDDDSYWMPLARALGEGFDQFYQAIQYRYHSSYIVSGHPEGILFVLPFFYLDNDKIQMTWLEFITRFQDPPINIRRSNTQELQSLAPFGNTHVYWELKSGTNERFNDIRANADFMRILSGEISASDISEDQALDFGRNLIIVSSQRSELLTDPKVAPIGEVTDCAILRFGSGFEWKERH